MAVTNESGALEKPTHGGKVQTGQSGGRRPCLPVLSLLSQLKFLAPRPTSSEYATRVVVISAMLILVLDFSLNTVLL